MNIITKWIKGNLKANDIFVAQLPIILFCSPIGLMPLKVIAVSSKTATNSHCLAITRFGRIMPFVYTAMFTICLIITISTTNSFSTHFVPTEMSGMVSSAQLVMFYVGVTIMYGTCVLKRNKLLKLFNLLAHIDRKFEMCVNVYLDYCLTVKYMLKCIAAHWLTFAAYVVLIYVQQKLLGRSIWLNVWVSYFMSHLVVSFVVLKFICIISQLKYRFSLLKTVSHSISSFFYRVERKLFYYFQLLL